MKKLLSLFMIVLISSVTMATALASFSDVSVNYEYETAINYLQEQGIITGDSDTGLYRPSSNLNRAEFAAVVSRLLKEEPSVFLYNECFPDVSGEWFAGYVCSLKELGLVKGYQTGLYGSVDPLLNAEIVEILSRLMQWKISAGGEWFEPSWRYAVEHHIVPVGNEDNEETSRGLMAEIIFRAFAYNYNDSGTYVGYIGDEFILDGIDFIVPAPLNDIYSAIVSELPVVEDTIIEEPVVEPVVEDSIIEEPVVEDMNVQAMVDANNKFAIDLYKLYSEDSENMFFSPYSISTAMGMTYEGAEGVTAEEMESVFYYLKDDEVRRTALAKIMSDLNKEGKEYELNVANALWIQDDYSILDEYLNVMTEYYDGQVENVDYVTDADAVATTINDWVELKTQDKIQDLISEGVLTSDTRVVLTNAIYFKGSWDLAFDAEDTMLEEFRLNDGELVEADLMRYLDGDKYFQYGENEIMQVLELPYKGEELSMLVLLPKNYDLEGLEEALTFDSLNEWIEGMVMQKVKIYLPKFKFDTKAFMVDDLMAGLD